MYSLMFKATEMKQDPLIEALIDLIVLKLYFETF